MAQPGDVLANRYRLVEQLGAGGMGTVWRAQHVELGTELAVKLILPGLADNEATLARFKREAKAAATLRSPHVVQIFDYGVEEGTPYIAMEMLEGESLGQRLERCARLPAPAVAHVLTEAARAVDKAHAAGILHRDLKPDNIYLCNGDDGRELVKVLDFGVAKALKPDVAESDGKQTRTGALIGSPVYMSPEQIRGQKAIDHRADLWSLGVIAYESLVGGLPFKGESLGDLVLIVCSDEPPIPSQHGCTLAGFDEWFARACARSAADRFASAREMADAFCALVAQPAAEPAAVDAAVDLAPALKPLALAATVQTSGGLSRTEHGESVGAKRPAGRARLAMAGGVAGLAAVGVVTLLVWPSLSSNEGTASAPSATREAPLVDAPGPSASASAARPDPTSQEQSPTSGTATASTSGSAGSAPSAVSTPAGPARTSRDTAKAPSPTGTPTAKPTGPRNYGF